MAQRRALNLIAEAETNCLPIEQVEDAAVLAEANLIRVCEHVDGDGIVSVVAELTPFGEAALG